MRLEIDAMSGLVASDYGRTGFSALYDHILGRLRSEISPLRIIYGSRTAPSVAIITPFFSASFPKDFHDIPAVIMSIQRSVQRQLGIGQMASGTTWGDCSGVHNITEVQIDVWARNMLEMEALFNAVMKTIQKSSKFFYSKGIQDVMVTGVTSQVFDPNSPRAWRGASQTPGEIWLKVLDLTVRWDMTWSPNAESDAGDIEKIEITMEQSGSEVTTSVGLLTLGLLDSLYLSGQLGKGIKIIRTGARY